MSTSRPTLILLFVIDMPTLRCMQYFHGWLDRSIYISDRDVECIDYLSTCQLSGAGMSLFFRVQKKLSWLMLLKEVDNIKVYSHYYKNTLYTSLLMIDLPAKQTVVKNRCH